MTSTKSQNTQLATFNYTENTTNTIFPQNAPKVVKVRTYDDGTILVHLIRYGVQQANCFGHSLEPILRIRVIHLNGTVVEIDTDLDMDSLNYCLFTNFDGVLVNPIVIYPLQQPFILINYYKAKNFSDPKTYEEWGQVIDWSGKNLSNIRYGSSYINPRGYWTPKSKIQLNINKRLGFLRYSAIENGTSQGIEFQQYSVGYGIFYAICSDNETDLLAIKCTLNAKFISYNQSSNKRVAVLYELSRNVNMSGLYCDLVSVGLGHACTLVIDSQIIVNTSSIVNSTNLANNVTSNITSNLTNQTYFIRVNFLSSGSVLSSTVITDILPFFANITVPALGWRMKAMPFGGHILDNNAYNNSDISYHYVFAYDENNIQTALTRPGPFITNIYGVNDIMRNNNTLLLASPFTNNQNSSWTLLTIELPKVLKSFDHGYGNFWIDQTFPPINATVSPLTTTLSITFYNPVAFSYDSSNSYIAIYKTSDYGIRQKVTPNMYKYCKISQDGKQISINIISSTFNQFGDYYIQMDNDFVKSKFYGEPLTGIAAGIWNISSTFKSNSSDMTAITGSLSLTNNGLENFLSYPNQSEYFKNLLNEISIKLPVRRDRLSTNEKFQYINYGTSNVQIIFSIRINSRNSTTENTAQAVVSDLQTMIIYKEITSFSNNLTNDLDENYGFTVQKSLWEEYVKYICVAILILVIILILYIKDKPSEPNKPKNAMDVLLSIHKTLKELLLIWVKKNDLIKAKEIAHTISGFALILINVASTAYFVFINSKDIPALIWPSKIIWCVPIAINLLIAIVLGLKKLFEKLRAEINRIMPNNPPSDKQPESTNDDQHISTKNIQHKSTNEEYMSIIEIYEETLTNEFSDILKIKEGEKIIDDFSKINLENAISKNMIPNILKNIHNKKDDNVESESSDSIEEGQVFIAIREEIEIILLRELFYVRFQKRIKEKIQILLKKNIFPSGMPEISDKLVEKISNEMSEKISHNYKSKIYDKIKRHSEQFFEEKHSKQSEISLSTVSDTIQRIQENLSSIILNISAKIENVNENLLEKSEKDSLNKTLKAIFIKHINEEKKEKEENAATLSMFILFIIADSESLVILDDLRKRFIKEKKKHQLVLIRVVLEIIKNILLIIIMGFYASSVVIYGFIPFMALITSCLK
ncbi:7987_t:CDS:2, partial [Cetraspora pellucida]